MSLDKKTRSAKEFPPPIEQLVLSGSRLSQANSSLESSQEDSMFKMSDSLLGVFSDLEPALVEPPRNRKTKMEMQLRDMATTNPKAYESIMRNQQKVLDSKLDKVVKQQGRDSDGSKEGETGDEIHAGGDEREAAEDGHTKGDAEGDREQSNQSSGHYESFRDLLNPKKDEDELNHIDTGKRRSVEPVTVVDYPSTGDVEAFTPLAKKPPLPPKSPRDINAVMPVKIPVLQRKPSQASVASAQSSKSSKSNKSKSSRGSKKKAKSDSADGKTSVQSVADHNCYDEEAREPECLKPAVSASSKSSKIESVSAQNSQRLEKTASTSSMASVHSSKSLEQKPISVQEQDPTSTQPIETTKSIYSFSSFQMPEPSVCLPPHLQRLQQIKKSSEASPQTQTSSAKKNDSNEHNFAELTADATSPKLPLEAPIADLVTGPKPPALDESHIGKRSSEAPHEDAPPIVEKSLSKLSTSENFEKTGSKLSKTNSSSPVSTEENVSKRSENPVADEESVILSITREGPVVMERNQSSDGCQSTTSIASAPAEFPSAQHSPSNNDSSSRRGHSDEISPVPTAVPTENVNQATATVTDVKTIEETIFPQAEGAQTAKWKTKMQGFFNRSSKPSATVDPRETAVLNTEGVGTDVDEDIQLLEDSLGQNDDASVQVADGGVINNDATDQQSPEATPQLDVQQPDDNLKQKDGVGVKVVEESMKNLVAADEPTPKAASKLKSMGRGIFRRPKADGTTSKGSFGDQCPLEKINSPPSPDRMSVAASEISLPLTSIEKKDEHFFTTATSSLNVDKVTRPVLNDSSEAIPITESRAIKVDYRNTKEIEIVNAFKPSSVLETPSPSSHQVESSQGIPMKKWQHGKASGKASKGKISNRMAKYVGMRLRSSKGRQTVPKHSENIDDSIVDDSTGVPTFTEVKVFADALTNMKTEAIAVKEDTQEVELVEESFPKEPLEAEKPTEAVQVVETEAKVLQGWLSKANDFILTGCSQIGCGEEVCLKAMPQKLQDAWVTPVFLDVEPVLSSDSKIIEPQTTDTQTDVNKTGADELPDGAETVDNQPNDCQYEEPSLTPAENDPLATQVESSKVEEIDAKNSFGESNKHSLARSNKARGFKMPRSLKKTFHNRLMKKQLTIPCPNDAPPSSKHEDSGMSDPTSPVSPSISEIVASLENASCTSEEGPMVHNEKSVCKPSPLSQSSQTAKKIPEEKARLFQSGVARWKVAKLLRSQKHRNAAILAHADVPAKASSSMEYRTVLAVSDESFNREEQQAIGDDPHLTPIVEMADSEGKSDSTGPNKNDASFESASIDPQDHLITSPTGGTEETGFESTLSILDDHSQDEKKKAVPAEKKRSEQTHQSGQSADVSYYRGTFDDDLSNVFMPRPVTGGTGKWFW